MGDSFFESLRVFCFVPGIYIFNDRRPGVYFRDGKKDSFLCWYGLDSWREEINPGDGIENVGEAKKGQDN